MKPNVYGSFVAISLMAAMLCACDDKDVKYPAFMEGDEVRFGAQLEGLQTRTYYGDPVVDGENRVFPIYWNDLAKGYDKIFIYAPDALANRNQAYYEVKPTQADQTNPAAVVKTGETGIQWGKGATEFYGFYPGNPEFNISASGTTVTATLPGNQTATYTEKLVDAGVGVDKTFVAEPDMACCMMTAKTASISPESQEAQEVSLQFDPLSSVLSVTVNGPDETNTTTDALLRVTSVSVSANAQISGEFSYDYSEDKVICKDAASATEADKNITVSTLGEDNEGDMVGVPLRNGQKLNVKLFVIPNPAVTEMTVSVITSDSRVWNKNLKMTNFRPRQIHPVSLPKLLASEAEFDYRTWISQLDPRIYISELSLPGSALSFNTTDYVQGADPLYITQTGNIDDQFNAGCRVFQAHFWLVNEESSLDGQMGRFAITTSRGADTGVRLVPMLRELRAQMEGVHTNGFCVVLLSDYTITGSNYTFEQVYERFAALTDEMVKVGILPESEIGPNTTIADVKGKIILRVQLNGNLVTGGGAYAQQNNTLAKIQTWSKVNGSRSLFSWYTNPAGKNVFYSPMAFGSVGSFEFTPATANNTVFGTGMRQKAIITNYTPGLAYDAASKLIATSVTGTLGGADAGNANCTTKPSDMSSGMWYLYSEEANAGTNYNDCLQNINNVVGAINDTYDADAHNKFYMTYCGGVGTNTYSIETIANNFNSRWLEQIARIQNKPYGWVLFNRTVSGVSTKNCIQKVISNNNDVNFKLRRNRSAVVNRDRPAGDVRGVYSGGNLF